MPPVRAFAGLALCVGGYLFAEVPEIPYVPGGSYVGVGMVLGGLITAVGASFFQPWLKERKTQERLTDAVERVKALEARIDLYEQAERGHLERLSLLADKNTQLTDMNLRLAHTLLVEAGRQRPGPAPTTETFLVDDSEPPRDGPTVLVVEDHEGARSSVQKFLELRGCRVEAVPDVPEALEALDRFKPRYVLLDLMLPSGDGIEVLRRVRELGLATRVIVTTGQDEDRLGPVRALKPLAVFTKPYDLYGDILPLIRKAEP